MVNKKALVTGGCGFIGNHLIKELIQRGYEVFSLTRKESDTSCLIGLNVKAVEANYSDLGSLKQAVKGMDYVFHLGAVIRARDWQSYNQTNVQGTENLLRACAEANPQIKRFIFISSISASGPSQPDVSKKEDDEARPISYYGKSKLLAEEICRKYFDKIPIVIIRPPNIYGVNQKELYTFLKFTQRGILVMLGKNKISHCFIQDLVEALILAAEDERAIGQTYFVTNPDACSWNETADLVASQMGVSPIKIGYPVFYLLAALSEFAAIFTRKYPLVRMREVAELQAHHGVYSGEKIKIELGFKPKNNLKQGLAEIISWYKEKGLL